MTWHVNSFPTRFHLKIFYFIFCEVSQICPLRSICLHSGGWKAGLNGPRFVRTIDVLSDAKKVFFCKFGIDFAFYNLAGCLAWRGSWLCPSLNIFGLKTGRGCLGWRKDTNRIYIFTTRQSGGLRAGSWSDIYNYPPGQSIHGSQTFQNLFTGFSFGWRLLQIPHRFILHRPRISLHSRHL